MKEVGIWGRLGSRLVLRDLKLKEAHVVGLQAPNLVA